MVNTIRQMENSESIEVEVAATSGGRVPSRFATSDWIRRTTPVALLALGFAAMGARRYRRRA